MDRTDRAIVGVIFGGLIVFLVILFSYPTPEEQRVESASRVTSVETADGTCYLWHNGAGSDMECRWRE